MAHIDTAQALVDWYRFHNQEGQNKKPYWTIYATSNQAANGGGQCWAESSQTPNFSSNVGETELNKALALMSNNTKYYVKVTDVADGKGKNRADTHYTHVDHTKQMAGMYGMPVDHKTLKEELRVEIEAEMARKKELDDMRQEIKELKEAPASPFFDKIGALLDHPTIKEALPGMIAGLFNKDMKNQEVKQAAQLSGTEATDQEATQKLAIDLSTWNDVDGEAPALISAFAKLAKENPTKYFQTKSLLAQLAS